ncbi:MAG: Xaa-Pro peptidase family protein, partial [Pseudomonadota bacterium]
IGAPLMGATWVRDIRTWVSPDLSDDGISLLADTLMELTPNDARIGLPDGHETHMRMPLRDYARLQIQVETRQLVGDADIIRRLRMIKSDAEIAKIEQAVGIANRAFARVPEIARAGIALDQVFRDFQRLCLEEVADWVPYLSGAADQGGYGDIIALATDAPLRSGDVLMLDTGLIWDGYFCDFDRNWSVGKPAHNVADAYAKLLDASDAAFNLAKPGVQAFEMFEAMDSIVSHGGQTGAGRLGHGLGLSLTEWPSFIPSDQTVLQTGMVLTLEPGISVDGKILVHEENIVITETGARYLSDPAPREMVEI